MHEQKPSILLIEDNPLDAELTLHRLMGCGLEFDFKVVDNRAAFQQAFDSETFDLILADYSLPDFDGLSALEIVRARDSKLPFVFVSGVLGEDVAVETLVRGATDYVLKQKMERLVPAVMRALTEHAEYKSRARAENELRKVELRFESLTNVLPAMVWTADAEGSLKFVNSEWMQTVGPVEQLFDPAVVHPRDLFACQRAWADANKGLARFEVDCRFKTLDGDFRWQLVRGIPVPAADGTARTEWVGTCTDTESQRKREAQLRTSEKLALTGRLASVIAHEINNPLEALTNLLFILASGDLTPEMSHEYFKLAEQELIRISAITKQTLEWSREEAAVTEVPADYIVEESLRVFKRKLDNKKVTVEREIDPGVAVRVVAGELRQVLSNLISNAIDAVPAGGRIGIHVAVQDRTDGRFAKFTVSDNGHGISDDILPKLFEPFSGTKGNLGSGLGLFISKELVERHGGELIASSVLGQGTQMSVLLPLVKSAADSVVPRGAPSSESFYKMPPADA